MAKRKQKETENGVTEYVDKDGKKVEVIRCGQCKGHGCDGCDGLGFLRQ